MKRDDPPLFNQCGGDVPHRDIPEQRCQSSGAARGPSSPPEEKKEKMRQRKKTKKEKKERKSKTERKSEGVRMGRRLQAVPKLTFQSFN